jgi:3-phenylpropionate/trans-cinnamate dioxygenase ferredoxin subunit
MSDWVDVARKDDLTPGQHVVVDVDDVAVAVFNIDGEFLAVEDVCTHDGAELASGNLEGDTIVCPRHGAKFCLRTGEVLAPPAYEPVSIFPIRIHGDMVQVRDERWEDE